MVEFNQALIDSGFVFRLPSVRHAREAHVASKIGMEKMIPNEITAQDENGKPLAFGSGFVIDDKGHIASNLHVIAGASSAVVHFANKQDEHTVRSVSAVNEDRDLVILKIDQTLAALPLGNSAQLQIGDKVLAIGNPEGLEGTVSEGIVSAFRKLTDSARLVQITTPVSPGSSGGPVIDRDGKVIGLACASVLSGQNLNFAIPIEDLRALIGKGLKEQPLSSLKLASTSAKPVISAKSEQVRALDFHFGGSGYDFTDVLFSIQNKLDRDIRNVRVLIVWKHGNENVDYSAYLIRDTIPANQARQISKGDKRDVARFLLSTREYGYEARVLDYEILKTSGTLEFH